MKKQVFVYFLFVSFLYSAAHASLYFKMTCDDPDVAIGEETVIDLYVNDTEAVAGYGLIIWQLDLAVDNAFVAVTDCDVVDYYPYDMSGPASTNNPINGDVSQLGAIAEDLDQVSNIGVGYTKIASITISGIAHGDVTYSLINASGAVRNGGPQSGVFDGANSVVHYTVTPEPSSLLLLSGLSVLSILRRRRN
jgi:hypothetical protein